MLLDFTIEDGIYLVDSVSLFQNILHIEQDAREAYAYFFGAWMTRSYSGIHYS